MSVSKSALSVFCCLFLCAVAGAQITITESDIPRTIGDTFVYKIGFDSTTVNVGAAGGPHVWTFDSAAFQGVVAPMGIVDKDSTPLGARFPDANVTLQVVSGPYGMWLYRKLGATQMLELGVANSNADTTIGHVYDPPSVNLDLPLTYGTQWQTTFGYTDTTSDTTQTVTLIICDCRVDAWGTATCPAGTYPCLRENVLWTQIVTGYVRGAVAWTDTLPTRRYWWLASAVGTVATANSRDRDTSSSFTLAAEQWALVQTNRGAVLEQPGSVVAPAVRVLPNPCTGNAELRLASGIRGPVTVRVCDATGRVVLRQTATGNTARLDLRGNRSGLYFCTVTTGSRVFTEPLVLLK
jgi:hypothetical protein